MTKVANIVRLRALRMQETNWYHEQRVKAGDPIGREILRLTLRIGDIQMPSFMQAYTELIMRHEGLRTTFEMADGTLWQVIHAYNPDNYDTAVFDDPCCTEGSDSINQKVEEASNKWLNFETGPLIKSLLFKVGPSEHYLVIIIHHIICDATSLDTLKAEFSMLYRHFKYGVKYAPAPICTINDVLVRQQSFLQGKKRISELRYWILKLQKHLGAPCFREHLFLKNQSPKGFRSFSFVLGATEYRRLDSLAKYCRVSFSAALLGLVHLLLYKQFGIGNVLTAGTVNDRRHETEVCLVGHLTHKIYLSNQPTAEQRIFEYLQSVYLELIRSRKHPMYDERIFDRLHLGDCTTLYVNHLKINVLLSAVEQNMMDRHDSSTASNYPLSLAIREGIDFLHCRWVYNADLLSSADIDDLSVHLPRILSFAGNQPEATIDFVSLHYDTQLLS
jgi:hypothetical protein